MCQIDITSHLQDLQNLYLEAELAKILLLGLLMHQRLDEAAC